MVGSITTKPTMGRLLPSTKPTMGRLYGDGFCAQVLAILQNSSAVRSAS
jgi:hypothetical protein